MDVSLYQAAAAMSATARWQDLIAENLSASSIPGARKEEISFSDVQAGLASGTSDPQKAGFYIPTANQVTNFQAGELRSTGNPMDFALEGPGFFTVQMANGQDTYTRDGEFQLNAKGQLVTKEGYAVLGQGGPLQFDPNNAGPITVSANGNVSQGDQTVGKLQTVEFGNPNQLTKHGAGFFTADSSTAQPITSTSTQIRQGFIESANTSPTTEMASMITAMRMFEANQKVLQMQSDRMSRVITDLGSTSPS
jgi:flagellar basal-body rod protein FlgF